MQLPLAYRPHEFDDWGYIRDAAGKFVAVAREPDFTTFKQMDAHRKSGTDPAEKVGRAIVLAVNNHNALLEIARLFAKSIEFQIKREDDDEGCRMKMVTLNLIRDAISEADGSQ